MQPDTTQTLLVHAPGWLRTSNPEPGAKCRSCGWCGAALYVSPSTLTLESHAHVQYVCAGERHPVGSRPNLRDIT